MNPPETLNTRHKSLALVVASGLSIQDAAEKIGYSKTWAYEVAKSPLFRSLVKHYEKEMVESTLQQAKERTYHEALASVNKLVELRDHSENENIQLSAAKELVQMVIPKVTKHEQDTTVRISLDDATKERLLASLVSPAEAKLLPPGATTFDSPVRIAEGN